MSNFFELLNQEMHFNLDLKNLEVQFIEAQKLAHPDNFLESSTKVNQKSALINQAYMTLRDPFKRAIYYLSLYGIELDELEKEPLSPAFLMQQMEMRERLEDANNIAEKEIILAEIQSEKERLMQSLSLLLTNTSKHDQNSADLSLDPQVQAEAVGVIKELRFWMAYK